MGAGAHQEIQKDMERELDFTIPPPPWTTLEPNNRMTKTQILAALKKLDHNAYRDAEEIWTPTLQDILGVLVDRIQSLESIIDENNSRGGRD